MAQTVFPSNRASSRVEHIPPSQPDRLVQGTEVSLYCMRQPPGVWPKHRREQMEIAFFFTPVALRIGWADSSGWREREIRGPHVCVIPAGLLHECRLDSETELLVLYVERSLFRRVIKEKLASVIIAPSAHHDLVLWFLAMALRQLCTDSAARDAWMIDGISARLVRRLAGRLGTGGAETDLRRRALSLTALDKVQRFMEANLKHDIHVADFAKQTGHSEAHFSELFRARTQLSPYQYLKEIRLLKAYQLILTGDYLLREIALEVGYVNPDHFSEIFRKTFRESPSVLLARARGASENSRR